MKAPTLVEAGLFGPVGEVEIKDHALTEPAVVLFREAGPLQIEADCLMVRVEIGESLKRRDKSPYRNSPLTGPERPETNDNSSTPNSPVC